MNRIANILSCLVLVTCFTSCHTNIIDEGMEGFVEQTTTFSAPNSDEAVDLGLSVKWAPYNVGASKPTEYGNYYAWGEIEPKTDYSYETYVGPADFFGSVDTYGTEYDVAYVKWGHEWRIPTMDELIEIQEKCKWEATERDGVKGMKVTGPNGNSIFFPAAGRCVGNRFEDVGVTGHYWQGCANGDGSQKGEYTYYDLNVATNGLTIRPVLNTSKLCYSFIDNNNGESEWDQAMIMSNGYYSLIKKDSLNNTIVYLDKVGTQSGNTKIIGEFDENNHLIYLHLDTCTYYFYNHHDGIANVITFKDGNLVIIENVNIKATAYAQSRAGVSQNNYINALGMMVTAGESIQSAGNLALGGVSTILNFGEFTPEQNLALDLSLTTAGIGVTAATLGITSVAALVASPVVIGAAIIGGGLAFAKYWEALKNEEKTQMYNFSAGNCKTVALEPVKISNNSYNIGMEILNSESIRPEYKNFNYCGIILQKYNPPTSPYFNAYSSNVETVMYMRIPSDGKYNITLTNLEAGYRYRYRSFIIPYPESINFSSPDGQSLKVNSGSSFSSAIYYSDIQSFTIDNTYVYSCSEAEKPYCVDKKIIFSINVNAKFDNPPSDYALTDWGIVLYNNDTQIKTESIGKGVWDGSVKLTFEAENNQNSLEIDNNKYEAKTLDKWFVSTYTTYSADGVSAPKYSEERYPVDLVYNQKPSLTFTSANVNGTEIIAQDDEEGYVRYSTSFNIAYKVNGSFWFDNLNLGVPSDVNDNVGLVEVRNGDGSYNGSYFWEYSNTSSPQFFLYLIGNLTAGGTFVSDNMLMFSGMPITGVSVSGNSGRAMQQTRAVNGEKKHSSLNK